VLGLQGRELNAADFCNESIDGTAKLQLVSPPYSRFRGSIKVSEFYGSAAALGTPQMVLTGNHIEITQNNSILWPLPTVACREQVLDIGTLSMGQYDVTWRTIETFVPPLVPASRTRIRTLAFEVVPAAAIPAADSQVLVVLVATLGMVGMRRSGE